MDYDDEGTGDIYDKDLFDDFGEGFETDFDAVSEQAYEEAFNKEEAQRTGNFEEIQPILDDNLEEINEEDYEFDSVVGGRDKKPVMSLLNKGKLSKYEMDELLNTLD
jgi:hypothetical protein